MWPPFVKKPELVWLLWHKAKAVGVRPSNFIGLEPDSYEAYCFDEAIIHFGTSLEYELEQAGHKPSKEERKAKAARETVLNRIFGEDKGKGSGFADPAAMFK
jgi:hypothetical protein